MNKIFKINQNDFFYRCQCGTHLISFRKDVWSDPAPPVHSLEIWEYRGETKWGLKHRIKLAFRILFGLEAKYPVSEILIEDSDIQELADAILALKA